jgi:Fic family protein
MRYNWQHPDWANFTCDDSVTDSFVIRFAMETDEMKGLLDAQPEDIQQDTLLQFMIVEAVKTSAIEGEFFSRQDIMSSLKKQLGIADHNIHIKDKKAGE